MRTEKETVSSRDVPAPAQREHPSCVVQCKGLECTSACIGVTVKPLYHCSSFIAISLLVVYHYSSFIFLS